jgi:hypothetical protein
LKAAFTMGLIVDFAMFVSLIGWGPEPPVIYCTGIY